MTLTTQSPATANRHPLLRSLAQLLRAREVVLLLLIGIMVLFLSVYTPSFLRVGNLRALLLGLTSITIIATGMTVALVSGGFDLSVGSVFALGGVVAATTVRAGGTPLAALLGGTAIGALVGLINGLLITKIGINPLITTLGTMGVARGAAYVITEGSPLGGLPASFRAIGQGSLLGIPNPVIIAALIVVTMDFFMRRAAIMRNVYYLGGNEVAARLSGIRVDWLKTGVYVLSGTFAAFAGVIAVSRFAVASPAEGMGFELLAISAAVIGGASLAGGQGTVAGALLGVLLVSLVNNGMVLLRVPVYWQQLISGLILLIAVGFDTITQRLRQRQKVIAKVSAQRQGGERA